LRQHRRYRSVRRRLPGRVCRAPALRVRPVGPPCGKPTLAQRLTAVAHLGEFVFTRTERAHRVQGRCSPRFRGLRLGLRERLRSSAEPGCGDGYRSLEAGPRLRVLYPSFHGGLVDRV
jgi:hypothetical protein